jgi:hypothetical protein
MLRGGLFDNKVILKPGDLFVVNTNSSILSRAINIAQKFWSVDNESTYNHAGIIITQSGDTFESLWKVGRYHLSQYDGCKILIVRHNMLTAQGFQNGWDKVKNWEGCLYPVPRLLLHLLHLAKYIRWKYPVCSELAARFLNGAGLKKYWWGITPDNLGDEWRISRYYDILYDDVFDKDRL